MINFLFIRIIILLIIGILCDTSSYVCNKNIVPCGCGQTTVGINARIVNGENAIRNSWPMIVSLRFDYKPASHLCGGTILSESYILTAAHCVDSFLNILSINLTIAAGVYNLSQPNLIIRQVDNIIIHPLWEEFRVDRQYDIAILHLAEPLDLEKNSSITRTCLPPRSNTLEEMMQYPSNGTNLVVIGWGALETLGSSPDILQQVTISSIHHFDKICANTIFDPSVQFCAGLYEGGKGPCYGDSGGPILQWIGDRWEQVGIVSYGEMGCAAKGYPGVFTRISYFYDWIESQIHNNNQTTTFDNKTVNYRVLYQCTENEFQCGCSRRNVVLSPSTTVRSENALPYSWSMIVSIRVGTSNQHICSGTILEDSYILTAAHCLTNRSPKDITIEAGMYYRSESGAIIRQVDHIYIHPNYTAQSNIYMNDIAILHLLLPLDLEYDKNISRICLSAIDSQSIDATKYPLNGTRLAISGWDITNRLRFPRSEILQQAEIYVIDGENSNCSMSNDQRQLQFCAGRYGNDKEICYGGDFGDPIFQWIDHHWVQVGLASYCRISDSPGVFTSLVTYSGWIKSIVNLTITKSSNIYQCDKNAPCGCGQTDVNLTTSGIIGGENAIKHSWPMIVSLQLNDWHLCGGTILSDSFILTAAGCIYYLYDHNITIVAGIHRFSETATVSRRVDKIYLHPNYTSGQLNLHDIAIIHLDQPLPFSAIPSIFAKTCVPIESELPGNDYPELHSQLAVIGWNGGGSESGMSDALQQISVRLLNSEHELCSSFIINNIYQFCAGLSNNNKIKKINYLCHGGSGGPVLIYKNNHWEQVGIIPYSTYGCNSNDHAQVYTRLSSYIEWMKNVTNSSLTIYSSSNKNSGISNQRRNNLIFEILSLLIVMFFMKIFILL